MNEYQKSVLDNGLRVVTQAMPGARSTAIGVVVEAGPGDEPSGQGGVAHLLEHLLFQGTSSRGALEIARLMDGAGGRVGGFTSRDYTCYYALVLDEFATYAIDLLGDILLNPILPQVAIEREKRAILCEIEAYGDDPEQRAHQLLKQHFWPNHPLGRLITGTAESLGRLTREDLIYFLHSRYLPNRIIISGAGKIVHRDFVAQVRDAFWRLLGKRDLPRPAAPTFNSGVALGSLQVSQAYFSIGLAAPPYAAADRYGVHLLSQILGGGISSRLFRHLRDQHGLVYNIHSDYQAYRDAGLLVVEGSASPGSLKTVLKLTLRELRRLVLWQEPVLEEELARAKTRLRSQILLSGEDTHSQMSRLATQELYFGRHELEAETLEAIQAIDCEALRRVALGSLADAFVSTALAVVAPEASEENSRDSLDALLRQCCQSRPLPDQEITDNRPRPLAVVDTLAR